MHTFSQHREKIALFVNSYLKHFKMKNKNETKKKLSLKKLQMAKIDNLNKIHGGYGNSHMQHIDGCVNGNDGSIIDDSLGIPPPVLTK